MKKLIVFILCIFSLNAFSQSSDCKIKKETIKKDGSIKYRTKVIDWLEFYKTIKGADTLYFCYLESFSNGEGVSNEPTSIGFEDGSKISKQNSDPKSEFTLTPQRTGTYKHTDILALTVEDLRQLSQKLIIEFTIKGGKIIHLKEKKGEKLRDGINCLLKS